MTDEPVEWGVIDDSLADGLLPLVRREQAAVRRWRWLAGIGLVCVVLLIASVTCQMLQSLWLRDVLEEASRDSSSAAKVIESAIPDLEKLHVDQEKDLQADKEKSTQLVIGIRHIAVLRRWEEEKEHAIQAKLAREREKAAVKKRLLEMGPKEWRDQAHSLQRKVCPSMGGNRLPPPVMEPDDDMPDDSMLQPGCPPPP